MSKSWTGGCQCGAVRYAFSEKPTDACICHCRMCQKQFGNFFGSFAGAHKDKFRVTRGTFSHFKSSDGAERYFCKDCGTPLGMKNLSKEFIFVSIGSLDRHGEFRPENQYGAEAREAWLVEVIGTSCSVTGGYPGDDAARLQMIKSTNLQHPDHDTESWPQR